MNSSTEEKNNAKMSENKMEKTTSSDEKHPKIARILKTVRICLLIVTIFLLVSPVIGAVAIEIESYIIMCVVFSLITALMFIYKNKLYSGIVSVIEAPRSDESLSIIDNFFKIARSYLLVVSIPTFLLFLEKATSYNGVNYDVELSIVIWTITVLLFVFKKKLPSWTASAIEHIKGRRENRSKGK